MLRHTIKRTIQTGVSCGRFKRAFDVTAVNTMCIQGRHRGGGRSRFLAEDCSCILEPAPKRIGNGAFVGHSVVFAPFLRLSMAQSGLRFE